MRTLNSLQKPPPTTHHLKLLKWLQAQQEAKIWYVGSIQVNELKPKVLTLLDYLYKGYFSQSQSLPQLNSSDLILVLVTFCIHQKANNHILFRRFINRYCGWFVKMMCICVAIILYQFYPPPSFSLFLSIFCYFQILSNLVKYSQVSIEIVIYC